MSITPHAEDRRCAHPGCITVLCTYNTEPTCYAHTHAAEQDAIDAEIPRIHQERIAYYRVMQQLGDGERIAA